MNYAFKYKDLQIIKHALQSYVQRGNAPDKDLDEEKRLLEKVANEVNELKEKYGIE